MLDIEMEEFDAKMQVPIDENDPMVKMALAFPLHMEWVEYDGDTWVSQFNWEESEHTGKPMVDLSICMTRAVNQCIVLTVPYEKEKFKKISVGKK